jgi:hypothetical protein
MAIPDDVAQYAEGRRIVSYFPLGVVEDGDQKKTEWLWTTISGGGQPYDFDSFRVFVWSLRRRRYETAYIERNIKGYSPVELKDVNFSVGGKGKGQTAANKYPGFSLCVEKNDGRRYRRSFAFLEGVIRFAGEQACEIPPPLPVAVATQVTAQQTAPAPAPKAGFVERLKNNWTSLKKKWFGR